MKLTEYFNLENIISWIKALFLLIVSPSKFIKDLERKDDKELISQFFLYFIFYTFFFIFINTDYSKENLIKQSLLVLLENSFSLIPAIITTVIIYKRKKLKVVILFSISLLLLFTPILIILKSIFISFEDYNYDLFFNIVTILLFIYSNYIIAFIITTSLKKSFLFLICNYILLNVFYLILSSSNIDNNAPDYNNDPIISEYFEMYNPIKNINEVPSMLLYTFYKDSVYFDFGLTDINTDSVWSSETSNEKSEQYRIDLKENVSNIKSIKYNFARNIIISKKINNYFNEIQGFINQKYYYPIDLRQKDFKLSIVGLPNDTILHYYKLINIDDLIIKRQELVDYHNSLIKSKKLSVRPLVFVNKMQFFLSSIILNRFMFNGNKSRLLTITNFDEM